MRVQPGSFLQFVAQPLALHQPMLQQMFMQLMALKGDTASEDRASCVDDFLPTLDELIVADGVAVIPVHGVMVKRSQVWHGWFSSQVIVGTDHWSAMTGDLVNRNDIETLIYDCDTPGGEVAGTEQFGNQIWKARQAGKQTIAVVNELCGSAGLWIASQCDRIVIPSTGTIGSLGVYRVHMDDTKAWAEIGFEKTVIHRGKYKGREERPLDEDGKADLQRYIDVKYSLFVDAVSRGRGMSADEVIKRWGDSTIFSGSEAVSNGLADEIGTLQDVLESLKAGRGGRVSIDLPPADEQGDEFAMVKLNATGQLLDAAGKVVGSMSELQIDAAGLTKYFAAQTGELIDSAVKTAKEAAVETQKAAVADAEKASHARLDALVAAVGADKAIAAFKAGDSVEKAKAGIADDLAAQLKLRDAEIATLKETNGKPAAPKFSATDAGGTGDGKAVSAADAADKDAEFAAEFAKNGEGYADLQSFAARKRFDRRKAGVTE